MIRAFPFRTFAEIAAIGFEATVYCPRCYRTVGQIDMGDERLRGRPFTGRHFTCSRIRRNYDAWPAEVCGCPGEVNVRHPPADRVKPFQALPWCEFACPRCVPCWREAVAHLAP